MSRRLSAVSYDNCAYVLVQALQLSGAGDGNNPRLHTIGPISSLTAQALRVCRRATVEGSQYRRRGGAAQECEP